MSLDFNEAPDYASILEESFGRANKGFERREAAERENDKRRIQNAGLSMEIVQAIAQFAPKAKGLADALKFKNEQKQQLYFDENLGNLTTAQQQLWIDKYRNGIDILAEDYKAKWKIAHKIKEDGKFTTALDLMDESEWKKGKHGFLVAQKNRAINTSMSVFQKNNPDTSQLSENDLADRYETHKQFILQANSKLPEALKLDLIKELDKQAQFGKAEHSKKVNEEALEQYKIERTNETFEFIKAKSGQEFTDGIIQRLELIKAEQNFDTLGQAIEYMQEDILRLVESGQITVAQARKFEAVTLMHRGKKGAPREELIKTHAKTFSNTNWDKRLNEAQKARLDQEAEEKTLYQSDFNNQITQIEQDRGYLMSGPELANYIKDNYDITQGGPISDQIKNRLTFEEHEDDLQVKLLENLWDKGLLTEREVRKLNSAELRETWTARIGSKNPTSVSDKDLTEAISQATTISEQMLTEKAITQEQKKNIIDNARYKFASIYADEMLTIGGDGGEASQRAAYVNAVERMRTEIKAGNWNNLIKPEVETEKRNRILVYGQELLKFNKNAFQEDILYGSEDIVVEAEAFHDKGQAHNYYKQMAPNIEIDGIPIHPMQLQEIQINLMRKKKGQDPIPKSEMLKAYEALPPTVRTTLAQKVSAADLIQAKIKWFGDGKITYKKEAELLLEGILDEEFKRDEYKMTEEVEETPKVLTTQQKQRQLSRESRRNDAVALKTRQIISDFIQTLPSYLPEVLYGEYDFFGEIGKGYELRKQEVESQNRRNRRKRKRN